MGPVTTAGEWGVGSVERVEQPKALALGRAVLYGAGNVGAGMVFAFTNAALPLYLASYGLPNWAIGLLAQDRPPLAGVSQIVVGFLSDRTRTVIGRRRPYILVGVPLTALALLGLALRPPLPLMLAALLATTTCLAIAYGPYLALMTDLVPSEQRGRVGSILALASMLGQLTILFLAAQLWSGQESSIFWFVSAGLLVAFSLSFFGVAEPPRTEHLAEPLRLEPLAYLRDVLAHREVAKYLLATLFFWLGTGSVLPFLTRFAVNELGTDESTAFRLLMVAIVATAIFTLPAGLLGDRFGKRPILLAGLGLYGTAVLVGSQVRTVEQAAAALVVTGAANALCTSLLFPMLADLMPRERAGEFTGLGSAVWELAQPLGAMLGGAAADLTGSLRTTLVAAGLLTLVAALLLTRVRSTNPESRVPSPE
jgi:Na+/melibiose symporter-like transporter